MKSTRAIVMAAGLSIGLGLAGTALGHTGAELTPAAQARGFQLSTFISDIPLMNRPSGIAFREDGQVLVSDYGGALRLYPSHADAWTFTDGVQIAYFGYEGAFDFAQYQAGGWQGLTAHTELGGGGFPKSVGIAVHEMFGSANMALSLNPMLTQSGIELLERWGTEAQHAEVLPHLVDGTWELFRAHYAPRPSHVAPSGKDLKATVGVVGSHHANLCSICRAMARAVASSVSRRTR